MDGGKDAEFTRMVPVSAGIILRLEKQSCRFMNHKSYPMKFLSNDRKPIDKNSFLIIPLLI